MTGFLINTFFWLVFFVYPGGYFYSHSILSAYMRINRLDLQMIRDNIHKLNMFDRLLAKEYVNDIRHQNLPSFTSSLSKPVWRSLEIVGQFWGLLLTFWLGPLGMFVFYRSYLNTEDRGYLVYLVLGIIVYGYNTLGYFRYRRIFRPS